MGQPVEEPLARDGTGRPLWVAQVDKELRALTRPESLALIAAERCEGLALLEQLGRALGIAPVSVTAFALAAAPVRDWRGLLKRLEGSPLLFDLETLCWDPWLQLDVLRFLRQHARGTGVIALWPGRITGRVATFSAPGRLDYLREDLAALTVLRPVSTSFPNEVPFEIERTSK